METTPAQQTKKEEDGPPDTLPSATKPCPNCGKMLRQSAVTCRFCRRDLSNPHAPPLLLSADDWETEVPAWVIERERRQSQRQRTVSRLSELQWSLMCLSLVGLIGCFWWRLALLPPPPPQPARVASFPSTRPRPTATPSPVPIPTVPEIETARVSAWPTPPAPTVASLEASKPSGIHYELPKATPAPPRDDRQPGRLVDIDTLVADYVDRHDEADEKYTGNLLQVQGVVKAKGVTVSGTPYITLGVRGYDMGVKCLFDGKYRLDLKQVHVGDGKMVRGQCDGAFVDISLSDCDLR